MNLLLARLKSELPSWWNVRPPTELEFYRLCRSRRIKVVEMPLRVPGFYMTCKGRKFIALNSRLRGFDWLETGFHEIGHDLLHAPAEATVALFCGLRPRTKVEAEARAFAVCTILPEPLLRRLLTLPPEEHNGYTQNMLKRRLQILDVYGI